jgi:hypothetical protein
MPANSGTSRVMLRKNASCGRLCATDKASTEEVTAKGV